MHVKISTLLLLLVCVSMTYAWWWRSKPKCANLVVVEVKLKSSSNHVLCQVTAEVKTRIQQALNVICRSGGGVGTKPYYFGKTKLFCMTKKGKRGAPSRFVWSLSHRWILYDGEYFEWGVGTNKGHKVSTYPVDGRRCKARREKSPAGYASLSKECLKKCARSYRSKYGRYRLLSNNCHHFANKMSEILCKHRTCPSWCR